MEFCFVCNRATDHFAEHDALVHAGLATYRDHDGNVDGTVRRTAAWDDETARKVSDAEYAEYVEYGYAGVNLDRVCATAGVTPVK